MGKSIYREGYKEFRELLVGLREEAGLHQEQLAKKLGVSQQIISYIETGVRRLDIVEFVDYAKALNQDPEGLFLELLARLDTK